MPAPAGTTSDVLRPSRRAATEAWGERVRAEREQVDRCRESPDPVDFYGPMAGRFGQDPRRRDDPALDALLGMARATDTWLDIGAGGGRYALPLALEVERLIAVETSPSMLAVLNSGMADNAIWNIEVDERRWPPDGRRSQSVDVALMAHVVYDIEAIGPFLDGAEQAASRRCVAVVRQGAATAPGQLLWQEIHAEPRVPLPMLPEFITLLLARGVLPEVALVPRSTWGYASREELLAASRRQLWLRPGSTRDERLRSIIEHRALEQGGAWALDWSPMLDGIVSWTPGGSAS